MIADSPHGGARRLIQINARLAEQKLQIPHFSYDLDFIHIGPSLGGVESLITHPAMVTYYRITRKQRYEIGITDQLMRLAVGIEDPADIIADLDQALRKSAK